MNRRRNQPLAAALAREGDESFGPRFLAESGYLALYAGHAAEALQIFEALGAAEPQAALPHLGAAEALLATGDAGAAQESAARAARCSSADPATMAFAYWLQVKALRRADRVEDARRIAARLEDLVPDSPFVGCARALLERR